MERSSNGSSRMSDTDDGGVELWSPRCCHTRPRLWKGGREADRQNGGYLALSENLSSTNTFERIRKSIRSLRSFHYSCKWVVIVIFQAPVTATSRPLLLSSTPMPLEGMELLLSLFLDGENRLLFLMGPPTTQSIGTRLLVVVGGFVPLKGYFGGEIN